jgi:hypothetical protein
MGYLMIRTPLLVDSLNDGSLRISKDELEEALEQRVKSRQGGMRGPVKESRRKSLPASVSKLLKRASSLKDSAPVEPKTPGENDDDKCQDKALALCRQYSCCSLFVLIFMCDDCCQKDELFLQAKNYAPLSDTQATNSGVDDRKKKAENIRVREVWKGKGKEEQDR